MRDVNILLKDMPGSIPAFVKSNADMSYTIIINSRLNYEQQEDAYNHEIIHIRNGDYDRKCKVDIIECYAHSLI